MTLTNGVTLAEAGRLKAGPQRVADTNHMSREAFAGYAGSAAPQKAGSASAPAAEASPEAAPSPPAEPTPPPADNKPNMSGMVSSSHMQLHGSHNVLVYRRLLKTSPYLPN